MKYFFKKYHTLKIKLFLITTISVITIFIDTYTNIFLDCRNYLDASINSFYLLINIPKNFFYDTSIKLKSNQKLQLENNNLKKILFLKDSDQLLLEHYKKENLILKKLLNAPLKEKESSMIANIIFINKNLLSNQIIIDRGKKDKVFIGQPIVDDKGVVGQVISTNENNSKIILICNKTHALQVQILRNNIRLIMHGSGCNNDLHLKNLNKNLDIRIGDKLVTSGLDGIFPPGYPVAIVYSIRKNNENLIEVFAKYNTNLKSSRYLLLLWHDHYKKYKEYSPEEVHKIAVNRILR